MNFNFLNSIFRKRGISLLEMVIYITISGFAVIVMLALLSALISAWNRTAPEAEVRQNISFVAGRISEKVKIASAIIGIYPSDELELVISGKTVRFSVNNGVFEFDDDIADQLPANTVSGNSVIVSKCSGETSYFIKISNPPPSHEAIRFCLKISYNSKKQTQQT